MEGGGGISTAAVYFKSRYETPSPKMKRATRMVTEMQNLTPNSFKGLRIRQHPKAAASTFLKKRAFSVQAIALLLCRVASIAAPAKKGDTALAPIPSRRSERLRTHKQRR